MRVARAKGRLKGKKPKVSPAVEGHLVAQYHSGDYAIAELSARYDVGPATIYRAVHRATAKADTVLTLALPRADGEDTLERERMRS